jgi:hypothetical protein
MQVSSYQMHNMLECYSKKLSRARAGEKPADGGPKKMTEEAAWSPESRRQATMEKISRQVLDKVTGVVAHTRSQEETSPDRPSSDGDITDGGEPPATEFTFNVIDAINRKRTSRLPVGDPAAIIRRLDQMAEKASTSKTESWV